MSGRFGWFALLLALLLSLACAREDQPLWADPGLVRLDADHVAVAVEIHNVSPTVRPIGGFELRGEDWGSLRFVDDSLPRTVPANDSVVIRLEISAASLRARPGVYRSGRASLRFASNQHEFEVPIEFVGTEARRFGSPPPGLAIALLALLGGAFIALAHRNSRPGLLALLGSPSATTPEQRFGFAAALAAALLLIATIPFGPGLCLGRAGERVGPAELAQCRAGLGGFELTLLPASPGPWWWLVALALLAGSMAWVRARSAEASGPSITLSLVRTIGLAIVLASFATAMAPASAAAVDTVLAQLRSTSIGSLAVPAWGLVALPLACAATVALAALPSHEAEPMGAALERLERLGWAALISTLFLGGWSIPGLSDRAVPPLPHAGMLACELSMFAAKVALVERGLGALSRRIAQDQAALLRAHARWTIPILLANLVAVALWRAL
ncbi:MAG: hypothetical protein R6X02_08475 [Enhygromyxa sp.]